MHQDLPYPPKRHRPTPLEPAELPSLPDTARNHHGRNPQIHRSLPSAAELAAGDSLHPRLPYDHRKDRLGVADPFLHTDAREEPPNTGEDRRSPASVRPEEEEGGRLVKPDQWARQAHCQ